jgi:hypothetical protein
VDWEARIRIEIASKAVVCVPRYTCVVRRISSAAEAHSPSADTATARSPEEHNLDVVLPSLASIIALPISLFCTTMHESSIMWLGNCELAPRSAPLDGNGI